MPVLAAPEKTLPHAIATTVRGRYRFLPRRSPEIVETCGSVLRNRCIGLITFESLLRVM